MTSITKALHCEITCSKGIFGKTSWRIGCSVSESCSKPQSPWSSDGTRKHAVQSCEENGRC